MAAWKLKDLRWSELKENKFWSFGQNISHTNATLEAFVENPVGGGLRGVGWPWTVCLKYSNYNLSKQENVGSF